jgi:hypothetical protein
VGLATSFKALNAAIGTTGMVLAAVAIAAVAAYKIFDVLTVSTKESAEQSKKLRETYEETKSSLESVTQEYEDNAKKINELEIKGNLSLSEEDELANLKEQQELLSTKKESLEEMAKSQQEAAVAAELQTFQLQTQGDAIKNGLLPFVERMVLGFSVIGNLVQKGLVKFIPWILKQIDKISVVLAEIKIPEPIKKIFGLETEDTVVRTVEFEYKVRQTSSISKEDLESGKSFDPEEELAVLEEQRKRRQEIIDQLKENPGNSALNAQLEQINANIQTQETNLKTAKAYWIELRESAQEAGNTAAVAQYDEEIKKLEIYTKKASEAFKTLTKDGKNQSAIDYFTTLAKMGKLTAEEVENFSDTFSTEMELVGITAEQVANQINSQVEETSENISSTIEGSELTDFQQKLKSLYDFDDNWDGVIDSTEEYLTVLSKLEGQITSVSSALKEQSESGKISISTAQNLIKSNSDFAKAIKFTKDGITLDEKATKDLIIAQIENSKQTYIQQKAEQERLKSLYETRKALLENANNEAYLA